MRSFAETMFIHRNAERFAQSPRGVLLALALLALGLLAVRPFCDVAFAASAHGEPAPALSRAPDGAEPHRNAAELPATACCASLDVGTLVNPADPLVSWKPGDASGAVPLASAGVLRTGSSRESARISPAALPERSYCARSARIQR